MEISRNLLGCVKSGRKNSVAINLQKHSGQSLCLNIPNENLDRVEQFIKLNGGSIQESRTLHSMIYSVEEFRELYRQMIINAKNCKDRKRFINIWTHLFDNIGQKDCMTYIKQIADFFYDECIDRQEKLVESFEGSNDNDEDYTRMISSMLRLKKFFKEKRGEEE